LPARRDDTADRLADALRDASNGDILEALTMAADRLGGFRVRPLARGRCKVSIVLPAKDGAGDDSGGSAPTRRRRRTSNKWGLD